MTPARTLDEIMTPDEVRTWRARIRTARETDLSGTTGQR